MDINLGKYAMEQRNKERLEQAEECSRILAVADTVALNLPLESLNKILAQYKKGIITPNEYIVKSAVILADDFVRESSSRASLRMAIARELSNQLREAVSFTS